MKTIKVYKATNIQLDWLVAKCEELVPLDYGATYSTWCPPRYTTDWMQMGPIIDREHISLISPSQSGCWPWTADKGTVREFSGGQDRSSLVAAARCYVVSKLGEEVEVPDEL